MIVSNIQLQNYLFRSYVLVKQLLQFTIVILYCEPIHVRDSNFIVLSLHVWEVPQIVLRFHIFFCMQPSDQTASI
jgi:hypothetical protein